MLWSRLLRIQRLLVQPDFAVAFAALLEPLAWLEPVPAVPVDEAAAAAGRRLRLSNREIDATVWLLRHRSALDGAADLAPARLKRVLAHPLAPDLVALLHARRLAAEVEPGDALFCEDLLRTLSREELDPPLLLTGSDLIAAGFQPGPQFRDVLDAVRDAQLNGDIQSRDQALSLGRQLARDAGCPARDG